MSSKKAHDSAGPRIQLSATQLIASALAAVTATIAASYLGISGTIIGAAIASLVTVTGNAVYSHSIHRTRERVRVVARTATQPIRPLAMSEETTSDHLSTSEHPDAGSTGTDARPGTRRPATRPDTRPGTHASATKPARPSTWRRAGFAVVGVFAAVLTILTSVELVSGRPLSNLLRGKSGSGTTVFGSSQQPTGTNTTTNTSTGTSAPVPQVTVTQTIVPKVVIQTPTVTRTALSVSVTPTSGPTSAPISAGPSATPTTSATPSQAPTP
jgi:hypothetical protein